jgi:hypothetical protein
MAITKFTDIADTGYDSAINKDATFQTERDKFLQTLVTKIDELTDLLNSHITDMAANNAKTGITTAQADAITANTAKTSMTIGTGATQAMAGNTTIPPISITGLPANHAFNVQVRVVPPAKGAKKGTVVLTWTIEDLPNRVTYSGNQTLI